MEPARAPSSQKLPTCPYLERHDRDSSTLTLKNERPDAYPYEKLHDGDIRLLTIHFGDTDAPLKTSIRNVSLASVPQYEALSYCWSKSITKEQVADPETEIELAMWTAHPRDHPMSKPAKTQKIKFKDLAYHPESWYTYYQNGGVYPPKVIKCNDSNTEIGGELFVALKALRNEDCDRTLWVDALCINQEDLSERAEQVKQMAGIYSMASRVVIWLGECWSDTEEAPKTLFKLAQLLVPIWKAEQSKDDTSLMIKRELFKSNPEVRGLHWDSLAQLLKRGWFQRVWCIQEIVKAKDDQAVVKMGNWEVDWTFFASIIFTLRYHDLDGLLWSRGECHGSETITHVLDLISAKSRTRSLLELLEKTRRFKSTLPSDKIYSLFNLVSDAEHCGLQVDYTLDSSIVYKAFARHHMEHHASLDLLYNCCAARSKSTLNLPSWVPDWTQPCWHEPFHHQDISFATSNDTAYNFNFEDDTLVARGRILDAVAAVETKRNIPRMQVEPSEAMQPGAKCAPWRLPPSETPWWHRATDGKGFWESSHEAWWSGSREHRRDWIHNAISVAFPDSTCTPEELEALWRTFVCDSRPDGTRPPAEWGDVFADWLVDVAGTPKEVDELFSSTASKSVTSLDFREIPKDESPLQKRAGQRLSFSRANARCYNRRFFRSEAGRFGWGVDGMEVGDRLCILYGASVPFILRPTDGITYKIIGDSYLHGMMHGQGLSTEYPEMTFYIS